MADIVTGTVTGQLDTTSLMQDHSDIRREAAISTSEIVKEGIKGDFATVSAIKDARHDVTDAVGNNADRIQNVVTDGYQGLTSRFFEIARDTSDLRAQVTHAISNADKAAELNALKGIIEGQRNTTYLSDKIGMDGDRTRALINDLKYGDLNRALIERNAELTDERHYGRWARHGWDQAQFAAVSSQMQNFGSQLQEARQGTVNFGSMSGNAGRNQSTNNVA